MESSITQYLYKKTARSKKNSRLSNFFFKFFLSRKVKRFAVPGLPGRGDLKKKKARSYRKSANGNNLAYILQFSSCPYTRKT